MSLAPNFALRNLILQWCENNNFELPRKDIYDGSDNSSIALTEEISSLVQNLSSRELDIQREAIVKIRMLSKENPDNRILLANMGAIPPLIKFLLYPDSKIQEHTVTTLLNLSLDEVNKRLIAREGAIPTIIEILQNGTDEARENSAATLFSLSMLDENKVMIGCLNGIPPLVDLLRTGTIRGKKDAATALFNLSLNMLNKSRAIKAGIVPPLLHLLEDKNLGMVDEALSILLLLASHPEGRNEIGKLALIETLVEIIRVGTPKNKECATAVLLELGLKNSSFVLAAPQYGVYDNLAEIARCGTSRAQRKANSLLQHMSLQADHTVHMVRGFAPAASTPAAAANVGNPNPTPGVAQAVSSNEGGGFGAAGLGPSLFPGLGFNALGGSGASGLLGAGLPEFEQVQQQLTQNPNMMREIMNMPAIQSLMNNPDLMRNMIMSNPQMREIIDRNPELAHVLNDPGILRQTLEAGKEP
ncbi:hypothetical protein HYC85_009533 [Camellia sinensis]|uniref:RING-type E3 ubiquitin transferase n=1 Tax=Camellia sinensis TaxID=4442 RepID=A0A7J7HFV9_CAMSI|nr:hypothetical protein HYC85_009533 [Camellia sinensis]